jgi:hypothetical protein
MEIKEGAMNYRTNLAGRYRILKAKVGAFQEKAERGGPTSVFYQAMLQNDNYEAYLAGIGQHTVDRPGYKAGPTNGRDEILYCRRNGWMEDG